jgi:broad specificity phosphatase PhoE
VLVVSHGGLLRCVLPALLDHAAAALVRGRYLANAELLRVDVRPDGTLSVVPSRSVYARP